MFYVNGYLYVFVIFLMNVEIGILWLFSRPEHNKIKINIMYMNKNKIYVKPRLFCFINKLDKNRKRMYIGADKLPGKLQISNLN